MTFDDIIRRTVEGQITSYLNDHPEIAEARRGKLRSGASKAEALRDSIAKRIVRDLCGEQTRLRLRTALALEHPSGADNPGSEHWPDSEASVRNCHCTDHNGSTTVGTDGDLELLAESPSGSAA